jgi:hypothetical protein
MNEATLRKVDQRSDIDLDECMPWLIAHGFPTFDEFKRSPDKWRKRPDEILESADSSTLTFRNAVERQRYMWRDQYSFGSLEQIERVCKEEGYSPSDLEMEPIVRPLHGSSREGKVEIVIRFWPKDEWMRKGKVITND